MLNIQKATMEEVDQIYYQHYQSDFAPSEQKGLEQIKKMLENPNYEVITGKNEEDRLIGYAIMLRVPEAKSALLDTFAICKEYRNGGYGSELFQRLGAYQKERGGNGMLLEVEIPEKANSDYENQVRRIRFYERLHCVPLSIPYILPNLEGGLPMLLLYCPFDGQLPTDATIQQVIQAVYDQIHFDVPNRWVSYENYKCGKEEKR